MDEDLKKQKTFRLWPFLLMILFVVLIGFSVPLFEGYHHSRVAKKLQAADCLVSMSHYKMVPSPPSSSGPYAGMTVLRIQSTLPKYVDKLKLSFYVRRINRVVINRRSNLSSTLSLLSSLEELKSLAIYSAPLTDAEIQEILRHTKIEQLSMGEVQLPRTELPWLNHDGLIYLSVRRTNFSNPAISNLPISLQHLNAERTRINDDGLDSFVRMTNLKSLKLKRTPCTATGINDLRKKMPWCKIEWTPLRK